MSPAFEIKGWCPSAHRPMESGDGLLIRAKSKQSVLTLAQLRAIADIAKDCGNGLVDLTQRAQLQLRGLRPATLEDARRRLQAHELYFPAQDSLVDILSGGFRGISSLAAFDVNALIVELSRVKEKDERLRALPPKFLVSIDTGGGRTLADAQADIRIEAIDENRAAVCVAGAPGRGAILAAEDIAATTIALMRAFVTLRVERPAELRRMRHIVAAFGLDAVLREAEVAMEPYDWRAPISAHAVLGVKQEENFISLGVAAPFGRWGANELATLADLAGANGVDLVTPTHWRVFLISARNHEAARLMLDAARAQGLIVSGDDPRLSVVACPGAPECPQAQGETRGALARLAPLAQKLAGDDGVGLHISGCAKGCARPNSAPVTLVANGGGFDLVEQGRANDAAISKGLDADAIERALAARAKEYRCPTA
jgi:precorrin-3B synthase